MPYCQKISSAKVTLLKFNQTSQIIHHVRPALGLGHLAMRQADASPSTVTSTVATRLESCTHVPHISATMWKPKAVKRRGKGISRITSSSFPPEAGDRVAQGE